MRRPRAGHTCRPLSTSTTRKVHYIIRGALERAVLWRYLGVNKAAMAEAPSPDTRSPWPRSPDGAGRSRSPSRTGKELPGLDEHQVRRWASWHRWTVLAMLAHAFLAVTATTEPARAQPPTGVIPLTLNKIWRLLIHLLARQPMTSPMHCDGPHGDDDIKPTPAPAHTAEPANHNDHDLRLEY